MNYSFNSKFVQILFLFKKLRWLAPRWPTLKKDKKEQVFPLKESRLYGIGWRGALKHSDALSAALPSKLEAWGRGRITKGRRRWQSSSLFLIGTKAVAYYESCVEDIPDSQATGCVSIFKPLIFAMTHPLNIQNQFLVKLKISASEYRFQILNVSK